MMSEGTKTRDGEALSNALQLLGTNVGVSIGGESGSIGFLSTTAKFAPTLDMLADMLLNSTFPADALERLRGAAARRADAGQGRSRARSPSRVFPRLLYGSAHPYGQFTTEESLKAITRDDIVAFHKAYFQPGRALVTVVGDVNAAAAKATIDKALAGWPKGGEKPTFTYPARAGAEDRRRSILVDKPGAAQSTFAIGNPGPPRSHAGLLRAAGDEHDPRRDVPVAAQREHPRGQGLQLRRELELRVRQGPGRVPRGRRHRVREVRRGARRVHEGAARHRRRRGRSRTRSSRRRRTR